MSEPVRPAKSLLWIVLLAALAYCVWLGWHWLPLGYSDHELAASASRVWDVKRELAAGHGLPWWTPNFMSGSSYALNHSRGFYLLPWLLLSTVFSLDVAGKLMALAAIFASAVTMYCCARYFLRHEWAAVLAGLAYMLCPEQLTRAATQEHMTISLFMPFVPLVWWLFARALETGRFRDVFWCALAVVFALWTDYKQIFVQGVFLAGYLICWLWRPERRVQWRATARTCLLLGATCLGLGAGVLVPGFVESKYVKLFAGDPVEAWQRTYSFKSVLALVDRDGVATRSATQGVMARAQAGGYQPATQAEAARLQQQIGRVMSLPMDSPERYAGLVLLGLIAWTLLFGARRTNRWLLRFCLGAALASVALATGLSSVASANAETFGALLGLAGVPLLTQVVGLATLAVAVAGGVLVMRRELTTQRERIITAASLAAFLFVPMFGVLAKLPGFKEIRAPAVFYALPFSFLGALLAGFFVTDVVKARAPLVVGVVGILLLLDYWPYQRAMHLNPVPTTTRKNLESAYGSLRQDPDWVKTYSVSGRYFHLLGPMYGGKPQVYEAFYNWMAPMGIGLLNQQAFSSWDNHKAFLNLLGARYVVFDKTDPANQGNQQILTLYRQTYPVAQENDDFVVFRNDTAHSYVTTYARSCLYVGDLRQSASLALQLAAQDWPVVCSETDRVGAYERVYRPGGSVFPPVTKSARMLLTDLQMTRESAGVVRIRATASADCLAVIAESYYPFWSAELDGRPVEVLRISTGLMGVELPAGSHELVLRYRPPRAYAVAGIVSVLVLLGVVGVAWRQRCVKVFETR